VEAREALSPGSVKISNTTLGVLTDAEVQVIHRVVCDPGRLSEPWSQSIIGMGLSEGEYGEITGLISMVMILDTCSLGLGLSDLDLPEPKIGVPTQYVPAGAKKMQLGYLPSSQEIRLKKMDRCIQVQKPATFCVDYLLYPRPCVIIGQWLTFTIHRANLCTNSTALFAL